MSTNVKAKGAYVLVREIKQKEQSGTIVRGDGSEVPDGDEVTARKTNKDDAGHEFMEGTVFSAGPASGCRDGETVVFEARAGQPVSIEDKEGDFRLLRGGDDGEIMLTVESEKDQTRR